MAKTPPPTPWQKTLDFIKLVLKPLKQHPHRTAVISLIVLGVATRFWLFGYPNQAVFDEVYFGKFVSSYFTHDYFFDIHPPLAKLLIAGFAWLFQFNPNQSFASIGTAYTGSSYMVLRFLPGLGGAFLPVVFYGIGRRLGWKLSTSALIGLAVCFDTALIAQSRFILIDSFLLLFGFGSLWAYLGWRNTRKWWWLLAAAALAGMAMSVKWTGLTFVALPVIIEALTWKSWSRTLRVYAAYALIPFVLYVSFFAVHLTLLNHSGEGDAFMTPEFQKTLVGSTYRDSPDITPLPLAGKIIELNYQMYDANARLTADHPYGSKWYGWPFMQKPISYWVEGTNQIWLIGNPIVWLGSTVGVLITIWLLLTKKLKPRERKAVYFLLVGYLINYLPFIGITRVMFLYHYLIPLGYALLLSGIALERLNRKQQSWVLAAILVGFLAMIPFAYGVTPSILSTLVRSIFPILPN